MLTINKEIPGIFIHLSSKIELMFEKISSLK